jgi:hypothetical protein
MICLKTEPSVTGLTKRTLQWKNWGFKSRHA